MAIGRHEPADITRHLTALGKRHVRSVNDRVTFIDTDRRVIQALPGAVLFDRLVVSLGCEPHLEVSGDHEAGHHAWETDAALRLRDALSRFDGRRIVGIRGTPYRCPPSPDEMTRLIEDELRRRGVRERTAIGFFTPEPGPVGGSGHPSEFMREHLGRVRAFCTNPAWWNPPRAWRSAIPTGYRRDGTATTPSAITPTCRRRRPGSWRTPYPKGFPPRGAGSGRVHGPNPAIHAAELAFEKWWLQRWFRPKPARIPLI